jgi:hypothetical protein
MVLTKGGSSRVHDILEARLLNEALDVGDLGGDGSGRRSDLFSKVSTSIRRLYVARGVILIRV